MVTTTIRMEAMTTSMIMEKKIRDLKDSFLNNFECIWVKSNQISNQKAREGIPPFHKLGSSLGVLLPYPSVEADAQHEQQGEQQEPHQAVDPVDGILEYRQKNHGEQNDRGPLVPDPHEP